MRPGEPLARFSELRCNLSKIQKALYQEAGSLGTILLSHKCFKFLGFCLQNFWQPQAEGKCSQTDTDSPLLGKARPDLRRGSQQTNSPLEKPWGGKHFAVDPLAPTQNPLKNQAFMPPPPLPSPHSCLPCRHQPQPRRRVVQVYMSSPGDPSTGPQ